MQAAETESKQKQAVEQALKQERDRADTLGRELTSLRAELDARGPEVRSRASRPRQRASKSRRSNRSSNRNGTGQTPLRVN